MRISDWSLDVCSSDLWRPEEAGPMQVVSGPIGREKVPYEAPEDGRLDAEMPAFLDWFEGERGIDPVLKAGVAHLWLVTLPPFQDGNGRINCAIPDMSQSRLDDRLHRVYTLESQNRQGGHNYEK